MKIRMMSFIATILIGISIILSSCSTNQQTTKQKTANQQTPESTPTKLVEIVFEVEVAQGIEGYGGDFKPRTAYVPVGTTVTWENKDSFRFNTHEVISKDGLFDEPLGVGQSFNYTFTKPGIFKYYCKLFDTMLGEIVVE